MAIPIVVPVRRIHSRIDIALLEVDADDPALDLRGGSERTFRVGDDEMEERIDLALGLEQV